MNPVSIYIHFPFCIKRCRYCDFVSYPQGDRSEHLGYLALLREELFLKLERYAMWGREVGTIYFGGGTPSLLEAEDLGGLLATLQAAFSFLPDIEITLEMRPREEDITKIKGFRQTGISRLSVGVQSFEPENLYFLGRDTPIAVLVQTIEETRENFNQWNMDFMYGLPFQDLERWQKDLERALSFTPPHLSVYNLTLHSPSPLYWFYRFHSRLFPSSENESILWEWTMIRLKAAGYRQYEISNFAQPGHECRHNLSYWSNREYLGLGVSAWSYLGEMRERNASSLGRYTRALQKNTVPVVFQEKLSPARKLGEIIVLGLRRSDGISVEDLEGYPFSMVEEKMKTLDRLVQEGWLCENQGRYYLSSRGLSLANQVFAELID